MLCMHYNRQIITWLCVILPLMYLHVSVIFPLHKSSNTHAYNV